jgi:ankyrin repeat protein
MSARRKRGRDYEEESKSSVSATKELKKYISRLNQNNFSAERIIDLVEKKGADPNVQRNGDGQTLLMVLCILGMYEKSGSFHDDIRKLFLFLLGREDIDIYLGDKRGNRCIHQVVNMEDGYFLDSFLYAMKNNPRENIDIFDCTGQSALHIACSNWHVPIANIISLLRNGANPHLESENLNYTPLYYSIDSHFIRNNLVRLRNIFDIFFEFGFRINGHQDSRGNSIMHMVACRVMDDEAFCAMVLRNGGSRYLHLTNLYGLTALDEAYHANNLSVIAAIEKYVRAPGRLGG